MQHTTRYTTNYTTQRATQYSQSYFFDASLYTSAELLLLEQQMIFRQTWLYVGRVDELMRHASVRAIDVAGTSVLITCDQTGELRAFHNVCPHRAAQFCPEVGHYQLRQLVCPYHAWTYNLEGQLVGVPREERFSPDFCRADYPLTPIRLDCWQDFIFLCFSETAPSLDEFLGRMPADLNGHFTANTTLLNQKEYEVKCNWKVFHDNTLCDYHVTHAHRTTIDPVQGPVNRYRHEFDTYVNLLYTPTTEFWQRQNQVMAGLSDRSSGGFFVFGIFPNLHMLALPNGVLAWVQIDPLTVDTCRVRLEIYGTPEFCPSAETVLQEFDDFLREDVAIAESVQKGYASGAYRPGPVNQLEDRITHHQQLIWQFLQAGLELTDNCKSLSPLATPAPGR